MSGSEVEISRLFAFLSTCIHNFRTFLAIYFNSYQKHSFVIKKICFKQNLDLDILVSHCYLKTSHIHLLHFVAFYGVASLFVSQVDNIKEGVDNRKVK